MSTLSSKYIFAALTVASQLVGRHPSRGKVEVGEGGGFGWGGLEGWGEKAYNYN